MVQVEGRGHVALADVGVGEAVLSADLASREQVWTRVIYTHTHVDKSATVGVGYAGGRLWLTRTHPVLLASGQLRKAADIKVRRGRVMSRARCSLLALRLTLQPLLVLLLPSAPHPLRACVRASERGQRARIPLGLGVARELKVEGRRINRRATGSWRCKSRASDP